MLERKVIRIKVTDQNRLLVRSKQEMKVECEIFGTVTTLAWLGDNSDARDMDSTRISNVGGGNHRGQRGDVRGVWGVDFELWDAALIL